MPMFDVYVDGAVEDSDPARKRLAEVMSKRYGLGVPDLIARMQKGKFRVKANLDEHTAKAYARDLESIGARVTVAESRATGPVPVRPETEPPVDPRPKGNTVRPPQAPPHARTEVLGRGPATRPSPASSLPPATQARPQAGSSLPPANQSKPAAAGYASGLSAAYSSEIPTAGLGALDGEALSLSALDGTDDQQQASGGSFAPPASAPLPASIGPAPSKPAKPEKPKDVPLDLFAPPDAQPEGDDGLVLALEEDPRQRATTPPPIAPAPAPATAKTAPIATPVLQRKSQPLARQTTPVTSVAAVETPRWKFAAGVLLAVVLGFLPAHLIAGWREGKLAAIDAHVLDVQSKAAQADAPVPLAKLDEFRDQQLSNKESEQRNITLIALAIWGIAGAGIAFAWFRRPWEKRSFS